MMKRSLIILFLLSFRFGVSQLVTDSTAIDTHYLEDQFYLGFTYNFLLQKPDVVNQRNLSYGLQGGFIKDIPLNESRTVAVGLGLGYGVYSYYSNLRATEIEGGYGYSILDDDNDYKRNKIETHMLEVPFEFRWRNSNAVSYKFWRIYTGFKLGYVAGGRSKYVPVEGRKQSFYNTDIKRLQYGLTFNFGYNTFNLHAYYALSSLFVDNVNLDGSTIDIKPLRLGLIFYIL